MLCVFPFHSGDAPLVLDQLQWIKELGGCKEHLALLAMDCDVEVGVALQAQKLAAQSFTGVFMASTDRHYEGWIPGSVSLFRLAAQWADVNKQNFLFLEPDAIPIKEGWLDAIEKAYHECGNPFMGPLITHQQPGLPSPYMEGVSVYPHECMNLVGDLIRLDKSWAYSCAPKVIPQAVNTPLVHHLWGQSGVAPTFAEKAVPHTRAMQLQQIRSEAVIFHRCKDGSLTRMLRVRKGIEPNRPTSLLLVFPFCAKDGAMFVKNVEWMTTLHPRYNYDVLLSYDDTTPVSLVDRMQTACFNHFRNVHALRYPAPAKGTLPQTMAFIAAARHVQETRRGPWLWFEYDMIPLKAGWVEALETEYYKSGKSFMGPVIPGMGHMNGTAIYPWDTPARVPKGLQNLAGAWDMEIKNEMIHDCHDSKTIQHAWCMIRGKMAPCGNGPEPSFRSQVVLMHLLPNAYVFHRNKDGTLIDRLRERLPV